MAIGVYDVGVYGTDTYEIDSYGESLAAGGPAQFRLLVDGQDVTPFFDTQLTARLRSGCGDRPPPSCSTRACPGGRGAGLSRLRTVQLEQVVDGASFAISEVPWILTG